MGTLFFHNRIVSVLPKYSLQLVDNAMLVVGKGASYVASLTQWVERFLIDQLKSFVVI